MKVRKFRILRLRHHVSMVELGRACGVSAQRISELELSENKPSLLPLTLMPKIIVTMAILVPVGGFALIGIGGDSLTRWLKAWINWRKHRRMIFYRGEVHSA